MGRRRRIGEEIKIKKKIEDHLLEAVGGAAVVSVGHSGEGRRRRVTTRERDGGGSGVERDREEGKLRGGNKIQNGKDCNLI